MTIVEFDADLDRYQVADLRESVDGQPQSRPLGVVHLDDYDYEYTGPRFDEQNTLLCSTCALPAAFVVIKPWTALPKEIVALCVECITDDGYHIKVEKLWREWNATIMHLAEKPGGGGAVQLLRWFNYHGMCKFLGFDDLHRWPIARGVITPELRAQILERDGHKCRRCPSTEHLTIDHIRPVSAGGFTTATNLQVLCQSCNSRKGGKRSGVRKPRTPKALPTVVLPSLADRAAEYLVGQPSMPSAVIAEAIGVGTQYLNRALTLDARFHGVQGCGRGHPSMWSLVLLEPGEVAR